MEGKSFPESGVFPGTVGEGDHAFGLVLQVVLPPAGGTLRVHGHRLQVVDGLGPGPRYARRRP